jgi:hypothetical protein
MVGWALPVEQAVQEALNREALNYEAPNVSAEPGLRI